MGSPVTHTLSRNCHEVAPLAYAIRYPEIGSRILNQKQLAICSGFQQVCIRLASFLVIQNADLRVILSLGRPQPQVLSLIGWEADAIP